MKTYVVIIGFICSMALALCGCKRQLGGTAGDVGDDQTLTVEQTLVFPALDVLWVVGTAATMCRPQQALAQTVSRFVEALGSHGVTARIAVVSTADLPTRGRFRTTSGRETTTCSYGELAATCQPLSLAGGVLQSTSEGALQTLQCLLLVGTDGGGVEQGLETARVALDRDGPNSGQVSSFLRQDAWLLLVFVTSRDDCSLRKGESVDPENAPRCALMSEKLAPVGDYVRFFKRLKPNDPAHVIVGVIAGDAQIDGLPTRSPGFDIDVQVNARRETYLSELNAGSTPSICTSNTAEYGRRYRELVSKFGSNGLFTNICDDDLSSSLDALAGHLAKRILGVCLQRSLGVVLEVTLIDPNGNATVIPAGTYLVTHESKCVTENNTQGSAIIITPQKPATRYECATRTSRSDARCAWSIAPDRGIANASIGSAWLCLLSSSVGGGARRARSATARAAPAHRMELRRCCRSSNLRLSSYRQSFRRRCRWDR